MSIDNLAAKWAKEETDILEKHLECKDLSELTELLPGRSRQSIKAKIKRIKKANPIPDSLAFAALKYELEGLALPEIMRKMTSAGYSYSLKEIAVAVKKQQVKLEQAFQENQGFKPTKQQLKEFING